MIGRAGATKTHQAAQNLIQIKVAPASICFPVIATALVRAVVLHSFSPKLKAARLDGLFLVDVDLFVQQIARLPTLIRLGILVQLLRLSDAAAY
jgi:hypothetical protein